MRNSLPSVQQLQSELAYHLTEREALLSAIPDLDDDTLADTLEGLTDLNEMISAILRSALLDEALARGLKERIQDMRQRLDRLGTRAQKKRAAALKAMRDGNIKKIADAEFTASIGRGSPHLQVTKEADIPKDYWQPQPPKLDRLTLISALKSGKVIGGAHLVDGESRLTVRTK